MKTIKIIDSLHLGESGVQAKTKNGRLQNVHLKQGDLDGACAVYSTVMILIMIGAIKYSDVKLTDKKNDKRTAKERLKKELFEMNGLHREGNYLFSEEYDNIKNMLQRSFAKEVTVEAIYNDNIEEYIKKTILENQPVLISIVSKRGAHALVAIGIEFDEKEKLTKILCLDPADSTPKFTYWNSVIDLNKGTGKYCHKNIPETDDFSLVYLEDILIISKKK